MIFNGQLLEQMGCESEDGCPIVVELMLTTTLCRILQQCQPIYQAKSGYGGLAAFSQDLLIRVSGL